MSEAHLTSHAPAAAAPEPQRRRLVTPRRALVAFAIATLLGLLEGTQLYLSDRASGRAGDYVLALTQTMPSWYVLSLLLPGIIWMARRFPLNEKRWKVNVLAHLPAVAVFTVLHIGTALYIGSVVGDLLAPGDVMFSRMSFLSSLSSLLGLYFVIEVFFYAMFVGTVYAMEYRSQYRARERQAAQLALKTSRLEASLARANLESLRMQLNPHFLFNTLNAISVLALKGERQSVVRTLTLLSDLLRVSLENDAQIVPLQEELSFLERYVEIEQIRFKDRLTVEMDIAPESLTVDVPALVLQPLVENAIKHGVSRKPGPGTVTVRARVEQGGLVLEVIDTGPGFGRTIESARAGIGLANTRARLEQLYGGAQTLQLEDAPDGGAIVRVILPVGESALEHAVSGMAEPRYA